jgi:alkenylglycerophosphocholine/alkenylglycerophosphoethanolamine hydrolase
VAGWLIAAALFAIADWWAVARQRKPVEYVCKPATLVALIGAAMVLDPRHGSARAWMVVALAFSLLGDVFLMLPQELFVPGLASFLLGHVAYIVALNLDGGSAGALVASAAAVVVVVVVVARPIMAAVWRDHEPALRVPVVLYMVAIGAMVTSALATGRFLAAAGAVLFLASDATIAWNRFVKPLGRGPLFIIVTYHLAQAGLVTSLVR